MPNTSDEQDTVEKIAQVMELWKETFEAKDVDGMMAFYAPGTGFTAFDLMPPIEFKGGGMWRNNWVAFFAEWSAKPRLEFADMEIHASGKVAVVRLFCRLAGVMSGRDIDCWARQTNCFRQVDGAWLMFHDHVSFPTDFSSGQSLMGLSPAKPFG